MTAQQLQDDYEMSQSEVGEKLFLKQQTICKIEQKAIQNFKEIFEKMGYKMDDLLNFWAGF